jgi:hypothetical protein
MTALEIALVIVAALVILTVVRGLGKPAPRLRRGDDLRQRREERDLL